MSCWKCKLHRKPTDSVLVRPDTNFRILKRNLSRVPAGSEVEIHTCNEVGGALSGIYGTFNDGKKSDWMLRSKTGFVVATSKDIEDLAILIFENEWYAQGPESLLDLLGLLAEAC